MSKTSRLTSSASSTHARRGSFLARAAMLVASAVVIAPLAACSTTATPSTPAANEGPWQESATAAGAGVSPLLFLGDSVAAGQAAPLSEALAASGVKFINATSVGGGNIVGPNAEAQVKDLPKKLVKAEGGVVVYQITTYDWGTKDELRQAYESLARQTAEVDADLIVVSMPPIEPDEFYKPHMEELKNATEAARNVAKANGHVEFLDASAVWGDGYSRELGDSIYRSSDGIHTCPQGAARFTSWLLDELASNYPGFAPAKDTDWANTGWSSNDNFRGC